MPGPKDLDPSSSPRALLGAELRHAREKVGLTQEELGAPLFVSGSFIGQLEAGTRRMQPEYALQIDDILGTNGFFSRNCKASTKSKYPDHFAEAAEAEAIATTIKEYAPLLIPGLLQTEEYARAVFRGGDRPQPKRLSTNWWRRGSIAHTSWTIQQSPCCGPFWMRRYSAEGWAELR